MGLKLQEQVYFIKTLLFFLELINKYRINLQLTNFNFKEMRMLYNVLSAKTGKKDDKKSLVLVVGH